MSSLGFQLVYSLLNERDDVVCERFFLPQKGEKPVSLESGRPLADFPLLFFSVSFEHDFHHLVTLLVTAGVEPYAEKRAQDLHSEVFIVCGGVAAFLNPEPIAPFVDLFVIGEAEPVLPSLVDQLLQKNGRENRQDLLRRLACSGDGLYAPALYHPEYDDSGRCLAMRAEPGVPERIKRVWQQQCQKAGHSELLTPLAEFADLYLTEMGRGCSRGCRFCAAGFIYRPPRLWDADAVIRGIGERSPDVRRIGLLGMEMADHATMDNISAYLLEAGCALSFSSLRADRVNDQLLALLSQSSLKSVAIAPDGTSERLRRVINKGLRKEDLLRSAERLVEAGIFKLKLYVMVGLPTETCEDLREFVELVIQIKRAIDEVGKKRKRLSELYLSVNCFIPKPWTPFQFHPFGLNSYPEDGSSPTGRDALNNLKSKITFLKKSVSDLANVHFQADKPENAMAQAVIAKGNRKMADVLYCMATEMIPLRQALRRQELNVEPFILHEERADSFFPWYIVDHGIDTDHLWHEYQKGLAAAPTEPCDTMRCRRCGVCRAI